MDTRLRGYLRRMGGIEGGEARSFLFVPSRHPIKPGAAHEAPTGVQPALGKRFQGTGSVVRGHSPELGSWAGVARPEPALPRVTRRVLAWGRKF